eukprot:m51a1_g14552 hypothetical protein (645) ;mRNA; f:1003130-1005146
MALPLWDLCALACHEHLARLERSPASDAACEGTDGTALTLRSLPDTVADRLFRTLASATRTPCLPLPTRASRTDVPLAAPPAVAGDDEARVLVRAQCTARAVADGCRGLGEEGACSLASAGAAGLRVLSLAGTSATCARCLALAASRCPSLDCVDLAETPLLDAPRALQALAALRALAHLSLRGADLAGREAARALAALLRGAAGRRLQTLDLGATRAPDWAVADPLARAADAGPMALRAVSLEGTRVSERGSCTVLAACARSLRTARLGCEGGAELLGAALPAGLTELEVERAADDFVERVARACPALEELSVLVGRDLAGSSLALLPRCCPRLARLRLQRATALLDAHLAEFARACVEARASPSSPSSPPFAGLAELTLTGCPLPLSGTFAAVVEAAGGPQLEKLDLSGSYKLADEVLVAAGRTCPGLRSVDFTICLGVGDTGVEALARGCPLLEDVELCNCLRVTDEGFAVLAASCPRIRRISSYGLKALTDASCAALGSSLRGIEVLDLSSCSLLTDAGIVALANGCHALQRLSLLGCFEITDVGVAALARGCRGLRHVALSGCPLVGDAAVRALARHCVAMQSISLVGCDNVGAYAVEGFVAAHARTLRKVRLSCTSSVSIDITQKLERLFPNVEIITN